jgi:hypothetical protein
MRTENIPSGGVQAKDTSYWVHTNKRRLQEVDEGKTMEHGIEKSSGSVARSKSAGRTLSSSRPASQDKDGRPLVRNHIRAGIESRGNDGTCGDANTGGASVGLLEATSNTTPAIDDPHTTTTSKARPKAKPKRNPKSKALSSRSSLSPLSTRSASPAIATLPAGPVPVLDPSLSVNVTLRGNRKRHQVQSQDRDQDRDRDRSSSPDDTIPTDKRTATNRETHDSVVSRINPTVQLPSRTSRARTRLASAAPAMTEWPLDTQFN